MIEALSYDFMQHALLAALLASIACGIIGTLVVVNRLVFLAGGVAHAAYGGVGLAFYFGLPVLPCTLGFSVATSLIMADIARRDRQRADAAIGVLWAAGMAAGIILLDLTPGYNVDLMSYLFGSIMAVPAGDLWLMAGLDAVIVSAVAYFYQPLLVASFDEEYAAARGVPARLLYLLLIAMAAVTVVMLIRIAGLILVIALLTLPTFAAARTARTMGGMMFASTLWSMVFCLCGLWLSYMFNLTSGAAIIAAGVACVCVTAAASRLRRARTAAL
ncbi:permease component of zinc ABC transporter [Oleidesulfovibrio alaskensis G20]|jgi:zinc transport system permease protein|uniref:Permease component of zinc ABC transporter n=1 Tax=Oleidesulfovibrio alaskensis (strain ATCC BAA-1058 / DSM 17464 / G20) TaxID=207559 RepID=Q30Z89_OLEA2|nr:metal ABC transporter permease [Oleidesulfovibrio alaskensis]ABB39007.1 permease component of zinc ABC transporter [Oleidesulfovibrio alaskensis G20]MBG0772213.1 metal ABC transporter permease [Oleidesulfovibrio alaskensis]MBL3583358.1 metal ABC transporter permease [Oleidesulfovibrio alaskensis]